MLWEATYDGPANSSDFATAMAMDPLGKNVYVTGYGAGIGTSGDYATVMYDASNGNELWAVRYNNPSNSLDYSRAIALSDCGNVYVTGYSQKSSAGWDYDYVTIKYSQSPVSAIENLITTVESFNLQHGIANSLIVKLQNTIKALNSGNADQRQDALKKLQAFIKEVNAQRGKALTDAQANILINGANKITCLLS